MAEQAQTKDMALYPGEFVYATDIAKAIVETHVGPCPMSLTGTQYAVTWNDQTRTFDTCDLLRARRSFVNAPEGSYVILEAPASDTHKHPIEGKNLTAPDLKFGRRVNIPGPVHFPLWPRQTAKVVAGHQLRSNQYLIVRVYNDEQAQTNWDQAVVQLQAEQKSQAGQANGEETQGDQRVPVVEGIPRPARITMGQLFIVKGTDVSFYIPPTGVEVLPQSGANYVRDAVTLERLEYCILLSENGDTRYPKGPNVIFPEPTETFMTDDDGNVKFRMIELTDISGVYVKVNTRYVEGEVVHDPQELFITGKDQAIYMPRPEHSIITYGDKQVHHAVALPAGEGRYVLRRLEGHVVTIEGPKMFLPDPRTEVIVRRVLDDKMVSLLYPGNKEALEANRQLAAISARLDRGEPFTEQAAERVMRTRGGARTASVVHTDRVVGEQFHRGTEYSPPRTITLDTKFDGMVKVEVWPGFAVLADDIGSRRVVVGPARVNLGYSENLMRMELSTGTPKSDERLVETVYLQVHNNRVSDKVLVETGDFCPVYLTLSYRVNFEGDDRERWFAVSNYVKFLTDHLRSLLRNASRQYGIQEFYHNAINIVRDAILGSQQDGERTGRVFKENGMRVYDVEVLDVTIENRAIAQLLTEAQHHTVRSALEVRETENLLEHTKRMEAAKRGIAEQQAVTEFLKMELQVAAVQSKLDLALKQVNLEAEQVRARNQFKLEEQDVLLQINDAELLRDRVSAEQDILLEQQRIEQRLLQLKEDTAEFVKRTKAVSPDLIAALQAFGDKEMIAKMSQAMAPLTYLGGESVAEIVGKIFAGTPIAATLLQLLSGGSHAALGAARE